MRSIIWRFVLPFTALILIATVALMVFFTNTYRTMYYADVQERLTDEASLLASEILQLPEKERGREALQKIVDRYADALQARITIIEPDGEVAAETEADPFVMENHLDRPEVQQVLKGETGYNIRYSTTRMMTMIYVAVAQEQNGMIERIVRIAKPLALVDNRITRIRNTILIAGIMTIIIAFFASWLTAKKTIVPITKLAQAANGIAEGDFSHIPTPGRDNEITNLTRAFAKMAVQIQVQMNAVNREKSKLEAIVERLMDGIVITNRQGKILLMNQAASEMLGIQSNVKAGDDIIATIQHYQVIELWRKTLDSGKDHAANLDLPAIQKFLYSMSTILEFENEGNVLILFQDRTRTRQLELMRQNFVSNVSHELRTPLTTLKTLNETLQKCVRTEPDDADHFLSLMDVEIDKLTQMVLEILDLSRIESGRAEMKKAPMDIKDLLQNAVSRMKPQADRSSIDLKVLPGISQSTVLIDGDQMERVVINLIHNAIKHTLPGGEIVLSAEALGFETVIKIQDTGEGISPEDLPRIFERFYKTDHARSSGGTGLGLSIAKHIVEAHNGRIWVESVKGSGATFFIAIPG